MSQPEPIFATSAWLSLAWGVKKGEKGGTSLKVTVQGRLISGAPTPGSLRSLGDEIAQALVARFDHSLVSEGIPDLHTLALEMLGVLEPLLQGKGIVPLALSLEEDQLWSLTIPLTGERG